MAYLLVKDFKLGMDRRRGKSVGVPGALWEAKNIHLTRGGDIETAKKFVPFFTVPGTLGMAVAQGQIYVFGSAPSVSVPAGIRYQRLANGAATLTRVLDARPFAGKIYAVGGYDDGSVCHFYDGVRITDWDTISDANASFSLLAEYLADRINNESAVEASASGDSIVISARVPGVAFTISTATVNGGVAPYQAANVTTIQLNRVAAAEVRAIGQVTITAGSSNPGLNIVSQVSVNGTNLLTQAVEWTTSHEITATLVAAAISDGEFTHGYSATSAGPIVSIKMPAGLGASANGYVVAATYAGNVAVTSANTSGGLDAVTALPQIASVSFGGTFEPSDKFTITINGTSYYATPRGAAAGTSIYVRNKRIFSAAASLLRYSKINSPTDWTDGNINAGAGFLSVSSDSEGYERAVGAVAFNDLTAVFSRQSISLYTLGADAEQFGLVNPLENTGTRAPRSICAYGNNEVFYLDNSGIRSLRARTGTDTPYASDIGSAIDDFVQEHIQSIAFDKVARAVSVIEPKDGRFWLAMGARIYVLSFFPSNKIQAWTYYEPGFEVTDLVRTKDRVYARADDTIYLYGGIDGNTWPDDGEIESIAETPFLSGDTPETMKGMAGADFTLSGVWQVDIASDPNRSDAYDRIGTISETTGRQPNILVPGQQPTWALRFKRSEGGRGTINGFAIHYKTNEAR